MGLVNYYQPSMVAANQTISAVWLTATIVRLSPYREKLTGTKVNQTEYIRGLTRRYK